MNYPMIDFLPQTAAAAPFSLDLLEAVPSPLPYILHDRAVVVSDQPSTVVRQVAKGKSISEHLFDATAEAKRWTSQVAMRLDPKARLRFFRQLDRLHDEDEWFEGDRPVALDSYKAFVRAYVSGSIGGKPALALAQDGRIVAIWQDGADKLTIEFFPRDKVRYLVSQTVDGERERFAGDTSIGRLSQVLSPFECVRWFDGG
ncbi:hypothetical protein OVA07_04000 [Novosphingobium sp. SL115]|uniref:hypothetical protein n=1 Tax=Novosphingobium sp. SL115 TaxID=2995150 RepID=UPI002274B4F0|nr:hypothetical protein [Novosphingobium sp. SL115]MCY1670170.1 hypothetical protein [Novosphingobium sp. SL115]